MTSFMSKLMSRSVDVHTEHLTFLAGIALGSLLAIVPLLISRTTRTASCTAGRKTINTQSIEALDVSDGIAGLIGHTPMLRIQSLSDLTGCEILGKAEFMNPGGSTKDRLALALVNDAEAKGLIVPQRGDTLFEGTVGSTVS
jgi:cysteine synthase A